MGLVVLGECPLNNQYQRCVFFENTAKDYPVTFVDPPHSLMRRIQNTWSYRTDNPNLSTIRPNKSWNSKQSLRSEVSYLRSRIPAGETVLFFYPEQWLIAKELGAKHFIYFRKDQYNEYSRFKGSPEKVEFLDHLENEIYNRVDLTLTLSYKMYDELKTRTSRVLYLTHGTIPGLHQQNLDREPPKLLQEIPSSRVALAIHHINRADLEFVQALARIMPDVSFVLIGKGDLRLKGENIHPMGFLPRQDLFHLLSWCDAGLLSYQKNIYHQYVGPLKYFEFPSCGLPVVSSGIPEIERFQAQYPKVFYGVQDPETAAQVIYRIIQDKPMLQTDIERFVLENSWAIRSRFFVELLKSLEDGELHLA